MAAPNLIEEVVDDINDFNNEPDGEFWIEGRTTSQGVS